MVSATQTTTTDTSPPEQIHSEAGLTSSPSPINSTKGEQPLPAPKWKHYSKRTWFYLDYAWEKLVIIILSVLAIHNLWQGIEFIFIEYPNLNERFVDHAISDTQVKIVLSDSIALMVTTLISILFAIRLTKAQQRVSRYAELAVGTLVIIFYQQILDFLRGLDYGLLADSIRNFLSGL